MLIVKSQVILTKFIQVYTFSMVLSEISLKVKSIHSCKSVLIDLFNLPPLPNERNKEESYMDMPYNYYVPNGKNSRLLDRTDKVEFDRETLDGNTGFQLKIPYLEHAFSTKYFVMDRVTGSMMGIYDKVEQIDLKGQLKPFNINQLNRVMHIIGQ